MGKEGKARASSQAESKLPAPNTASMGIFGVTGAVHPRSTPTQPTAQLRRMMRSAGVLN